MTLFRKPPVERRVMLKHNRFGGVDLFIDRQGGFKPKPVRIETYEAKPSRRFWVQLKIKCDIAIGHIDQQARSRPPLHVVKD